MTLSIPSIVKFPKQISDASQLHDGRPHRVFWCNITTVRAKKLSDCRADASLPESVGVYTCARTGVHTCICGDGI